MWRNSRAIRTIILAQLATTIGLQRANAQPPAQFEAVSIKPDRSDTGNSGENTARGRFTVTNDSLKKLVELAFGVKEFQIAGDPGWIGTERYDIIATTGTGRDLGDTELRPLLQAMLSDRFALKFHRETKQLTVYSLVVAKGGPKLKTHTGAAGSSTTTSSASMSATKATTAMLASHLSTLLGRTVIDNTRLSGEFDYHLEWAPDKAGTEAPSGPSIFTALQEQLGLKLNSAKGPVETIVIDSAEKPSEN
jgi:uncharacterized protein (TIGR03435 family)